MSNPYLLRFRDILSAIDHDSRQQAIKEGKASQDDLVSLAWVAENIGIEAALRCHVLMESPTAKARVFVVIITRFYGLEEVGGLLERAVTAIKRYLGQLGRHEEGDPAKLADLACHACNAMALEPMMYSMLDEPLPGESPEVAKLIVSDLIHLEESYQ